jgi:hypothetical protein
MFEVPCSHDYPKYADSDGNERCDECDRIVARPHDFGGNST